MILMIRLIQAIKSKLKTLQRYKVIIILFLVMFFYFVNEVSITGDINLFSFGMKDENRPVVALTFDDGPHPGYANRLVEILAEENVKGTFFVVGKMVKKYPDLLKLEFLSGHEIGNHTYSDLRITMISEDRAIKEVKKTQVLIKKITGKPSRLLRPPGGHYNGVTVDIARECGCQIILWTLNSDDIVSPPAWKIYGKVVSKVRDEDIVVFHDGIDSTLKALPSIIKKLKKKGFRFVTVSELMEIKKKRLYANSRH